MQFLEIQDKRVPALGLGTWQLSGDACVAGVVDALEIGYRHIDTAQMYDNEEQVGAGIRRAGVQRGQIFLTTKLLPENLTPQRVIDSTHESLAKLKVDEVDLLLIHWPNPDLPLAETLDAMVGLQSEGATKHIGVSNFPPSMVDEAMQQATIFCNQVECHPYLSQTHLISQAQEHGFMVTAYCPLARGKVLKDDALKRMGEARGKSPAQIVLRWLLQQPNVSAIPKAASHEHRRQNFDVFDFELSEDEVNQISQLNRDDRLIEPDWAPAWER